MVIFLSSGRVEAGFWNWLKTGSVVMDGNKKVSAKFQKSKSTPVIPPPEKINDKAESWQLIGPGGGGRITSITEDPSNPNNLYATINVGGARRSRDGGKTWEIINRGFAYDLLGKSAQRMTDIWVHPTRSNLLLAAGLNGHIYAMDTSKDSVWKLIYTHPQESVNFSKIISDPADSNMAYAGVGSIQKLILGVDARRTGDFWQDIKKTPAILQLRWDGAQWNTIEVGAITGVPRNPKGAYLNIYSIAANPANPKEMFFVTERGVFKGTRDNQEKIITFQPVTNGLPPADDIHGGKMIFSRGGSRAYLTILNLCPHPALPKGMCSDSRADRGGVFRSTDGGATWQELTQGKRGLDNVNSNYFDIAFDPQDEKIIYLAQTRIEGLVDGTLYRSQDGGDTWSNRIDKTKFNPGWLAMNHYGPDFIAPSKISTNVYWTIGGGKLFKGDDSGIAPPVWTNVMTKQVGADEWTTTGSEAIALAWSIAIDPKNSDILYLPYGDHSYFKSMNGGDSMKALVTFRDMRKLYKNTGDAGTLIVDEIESKRVYAATQGPHQKLQDGGVMYSMDGGVTWLTVGGALTGGTRGLPRGAMTDLLVEYSGIQRNLYVANYGNDGWGGGLYMLNNVDGANNWVEIFNIDGVHTIASRDNFTTLFVGVDKGGLYKLEKINNQWKVTKGPINIGGSTVFYDMETGPDTGAIYAATNMGLFSIDSNDTVTLMKSFSIPSQSAVEVHPKNEDLMYLAYDSGEVLRSTNRGTSWEEISRDIPTRGFIVIKVDPLVDTIYVESPGGGIWKKSYTTFKQSGS